MKMSNATANGTVCQRANGQIVIRLGSGNGELIAPKGVTLEQAKEIACVKYPVGTPSRKSLIQASLREIAG
jgi:hypothetical protein